MYKEKKKNAFSQLFLFFEISMNHSPYLGMNIVDDFVSLSITKFQFYIPNNMYSNFSFIIPSINQLLILVIKLNPCIA